MAAIYDCTVPSELLAGTRLARAAISRGELVVIPTDTVYGLAADAFDPRAVQRLLDAKGRTRQSPPPVLIADVRTLEALAESLSPAARELTAEFWPGGLTIVVKARASLMWDLGETHGTVALRQPNHPLALELLAETGPLAVSSANLTGQPAASSAAEALGMLGESVSVYLDSGHPAVGVEPDAELPSATAALPSTIVDATHPEEVRIIREGAVASSEIRRIVGAALIDRQAD
ncbi:threonylcarbamoyl-AMP synthase [Subtercola boreus]|uniref:L-threonylcarbamoyladenylate synthase n=1 Tax=Subtercola boreus TaxID=120213 RepID=A0A3E0VRI1_9MICO|nr:L-threonylcarbamoyladenylate synthase [Subtercola boreus]RFA12058.1 threonylcarbamoyl-AMP synthase [Subtercola boreus]